MPSSTPLERLLDRLEAAKRQFGTPQQAGVPRLLTALGRSRFQDAASLVRFHEALLFFRAYPADAGMLRLTEELLGSFSERLGRFERAGGDLAPFDEPDVSGIAGSSLSAIFTYQIANWLAGRRPAQVDIDWDASDESLLGPLLLRLHPLYAEDALVEANIPYREWFRAAKSGRGSDLEWLMSRIEKLRLAPELYEHARLAIHWELENSRMSRSRLRLPGRRGFFYHPGPLLRRADISLAAELNSPPLLLERLSRSDGEQMLDLARETSAMRYRELHGFTYGDPRSVIRVELGRGVEAFVAGVPPEHRLPLRAYHAGMFFKNAVPIGYIECLSLFERIEVGFNLYYTFREGETAWLYARLLRLFRQLLGVSSFAVDPYQLGLHNEEAIESGAFWFYRKLGFRPANDKVKKLLAAEEAQLRSDPAHRTPARTLQRLAAGWMIYDLPGTSSGDWDHFEIRRLAMRVQEPPFPASIERAKRGVREAAYLKLMQKDPKSRRVALRLGSGY